MAQTYHTIRRFCDIGAQDVAIVGGKNASLGEMYRSLAHQGIKVPNGFATTAQAFRDFITHNNLDQKIRQALLGLDTHNVRQLADVGHRIRNWIHEAELPPQLMDELHAAYEELGQDYGSDPDVAVRSSATAEDLPDASFAGQQETYLNISGIDDLRWATKRVFASLFTDRALSYRVDKQFDHLQVALSVGVQKMVRSDMACSGVMFTLDTESGFRDIVMITSAYGLGETVVQGTVNPDEFHVYKPTLQSGHRAIIKRQRGEKAIKMVYADHNGQGALIKTVEVRREQRERFSITDDEALTLARYACAIEKHYSALAGKSQPMDIEWAKDGLTHELFIVQARPETVCSRQNIQRIESYTLEERGKILIQGKSIGHKIASGRARIILDAADMHELQPGEVLVTDITDPDWEPVMKIASAMVTNRGGRTCHAAIVARELGVPAVVGTGIATETLRTGDLITISCAEGDTGYIYEGALHFTQREQMVDIDRRPRTKIMLNVGDPDKAYEAALLPNDGVGLARLEFIINTRLGIHPQAALQFDRLPPELKHTVAEMTAGYASPRDFYVQRLAEGIGTIAAAFYPKPVIVRLSDFKSNEYAALVGGSLFEPHEENPMLGFRGASRYPSHQFAECFALECEALRLVRDTMGLTNTAVMIPFVRTVDEQKRVLQIMADQGLKRGERGLKVYLMCELPTNVILADQFLEHCDGFSIGSNDLTQLTLGVDRDSGMLQGYDERDPAVKALMHMAIQAARKHGKYVGICGQAPSDFPEITRWLVEQGIVSISLNPDSALNMTELVLSVEAEQASAQPRRPLQNTRTAGAGASPTLLQHPHPTDT
jgi:pyruvate, water dikinase